LHRAGVVRLFATVALIATVGAMPAVTGCDSCSPASECNAKNGVSASSASPGGPNNDICGVAGQITPFYSGDKLTGQVYDWGVIHTGHDWLCTCSDDNDVLDKCTFSSY
jgi:hypothetical protein